MKRTLAVIGLTVTLALGLSACAPPSKTPPLSVERATAAPSEPRETTNPVPEVALPALVIDAVEPMGFAETLDPPDYAGTFEIRDAENGYPADTDAGPRFLLAHATSPGRALAPGNAWQRLAAGDRIYGLGDAWVITERVEAPKSWPTDDAALVGRTFGAEPGTLVLITCVPRSEGRATHNLVLIAEEAS